MIFQHAKFFRESLRATKKITCTVSQKFYTSVTK